MNTYGLEKCNVWQKSQRRGWKTANGGSIGARVLGTGTGNEICLCFAVWEEICPPEVLLYHHLALKAGSNVANGAFRTGPVGLPVVMRRCRLRWLKADKDRHHKWVGTHRCLPPRFMNTVPVT